MAGRPASGNNVASITLWPGFIRTEDVLGQADVYSDLSATVSQLFPGRAVAALAGDPRIMAKTGERFRATDLADEYGFTDDESRPSPR